MKRSQMYKKVNCKNSLFNHVNRNVVYPTLFFNPNLDDEEIKNSGVEIIELRSDEDPTENEQHNKHQWCNIRERHEEYQDSYEVNKTTRDKRLVINENSNCVNLNGSRNRDEEALNQFVSDFYGLDCYDRGERISTINPHSKFFTIIDNHRTSDTSSDSNQYDDIEVMQCENNYDDRTFTYDNDDNAEKRTVWIYALKNKRYLSEQDFELINIPSKDSNSTTDDDETVDDGPYIRRIATPIPTYISKMNFSLSPTLPTVTEVSESNKQASNKSDISTKNTDCPLQKPLRDLCKNKTTETQTIDNNNENAENKNINYENNWQSLSPRERSLKQGQMNEQNSKKERQTQTYCEPTVVIRDAETSPTYPYIASFERDVDDIEINEDESKTANKDLSSDNIIDRSSDESLCYLQKRHIKLTPHRTLFKDATDPIEKKLDGNWIGETLSKDVVLNYHDEKYNEVLDEYLIDNNAQSVLHKAGGAFEKCASDTLIIRNMSLLKPAECNQYLPHLPVTDSVPCSLHLSMSMDTDCGDKRKSWFIRFLQFFHCCK